LTASLQIRKGLTYDRPRQPTPPGFAGGFVNLPSSSDLDPLKSQGMLASCLRLSKSVDLFCGDGGWEGGSSPSVARWNSGNRARSRGRGRGSPLAMQASLSTTSQGSRLASCRRTDSTTERRPLDRLIPWLVPSSSLHGHVCSSAGRFRLPLRKQSFACMKIQKQNPGCTAKTTAEKKHPGCTEMRIPDPVLWCV